MRRRMRANIEIDGVPGFWEDGLFAASGETVAFQLTLPGLKTRGFLIE